MNVLVTGGAGCIGSDVTKRLLADGHQVTVFDNFSSGKIEHVAPYFNNVRFRLMEADILDITALDKSMAGVDEVWHLAANPDVKFTPGQGTDKDLQQNVFGTYQVLESMRRNGVRRLVFASTSAVYGPAEDGPTSELAATHPISLYGASKLGCEALIRAFRHLFEMKCCIFRLANIVGSKSRKTGTTVISDFIRKLESNPSKLEILGNGKQAKSYLLSTDCVDAMVFATRYTSEPLALYNVGCADSLSVNTIADIVVRALGLSDVKYIYTGTESGWPGDVPRFLLDVSKINNLGWQARYNSEHAVSIAVQQMIEIRSTCPIGVETCKL